MEPQFEHDMLTIPANVDNYARSRPLALAMIDGKESLNWGEVGERVDSLARALISDGLQKDDVVGLITGGGAWPYIVILAILKAGGVVAPFSALLRPEDVETLIRDCDARYLFLGEGKIGHGEALAMLLGVDMPVRISEEEIDDLPVRSCTSLITSTKPAVQFPPIVPDDRCNIIYSSGTTGLPKGIVQTHLIRALGCASLGASTGITPTSRYLLAIPPHTNVTWVGFLTCVMQGACFYAMGAFDLNDFFDILAEYRPTGAFLVPVQIQAILEHPRAADADFSCFQNLLSGGAPLPEGTKRLVDQHLRFCFNELWGLTEGIATCISPVEIAEREAKGRFGSVGRAMSGVDLRLIDAEDREIIGPGTGEVVGRGALIMKEYLNRPEMNEAIKWFDEKNRLFIRTGDVAERDEDGYFYIRGRTKEMIISGGMNVYPVDIENVFADHPDVLEAAVYGVAHPKWGETPVASVVARASSSIDAEEIRAWVNDRVSKHQRLAAVDLRGAALPRNVSGKILKGQLQEEWRSAHSTAE